MDKWPSIPVLVMRGNTPTEDSALFVLQNLLVENGELVAIGKVLINKYIEFYNFVDVQYKFKTKKYKHTSNTGCKSRYHASPCAKKALWVRSLCYNCEILEFNWERAEWPRLSVLERHVSSELASIIKMHFSTKLFYRLLLC